MGPAGLKGCEAGCGCGDGKEGSVDGAAAPVLDVAEGAGDAVEKRSLKFEACEATRGFGAANWVEDVVVEVVAGGGERLANTEG